MPIKGKAGIVSTIVLWFFGTWMYGQEPPDTLTVKTPRDSISLQQLFETSSVVDSADLHPSDIRLLQDSVVSDTSALSATYALESVNKHSPAKATIMSAVLPGLGQAYNKKYWKIPVVYAAIGTSVYFLIKWENEYQRYRRAYIDYNDGDPNTNYFTTLNLPPYVDVKQTITRRKDGYRRYRDWSMLAVIITYGLNVLDANVDAHFFDYNIDDDISLNIQPCFLESGANSKKIGLNLRFTF